MHLSSMLKMEWFVENCLKDIAVRPCKVLDVGSYDVNGCYRKLFSADSFHYVGMDMVRGPNVDICCDTPYFWSEIESDSFDVVISGQALEHVEFPWDTFAEMARVLKKGGILAVIVPQGHAYHGHPIDCYRYFSDGLVALAKYNNLEPVHASTNMAPYGAPHTWYSMTAADSFLIAKKPLYSTQNKFNISTYSFEKFDKDGLETGFIEAKRQNESTKKLYYSSSLLEIASQLLEIEQHDLAALLINKSITYNSEINDDHPYFYWRLSAILLRMNNLEGAKRAQEKAISIDPSIPYLHLHMSRIFDRLGETAQAIQKARDAIAAKDGDPRLYSHLGNLLKKSGDVEGAREALEKARSLAS